MIKAAVVGVTGFGSTHYHDLLREYEAGRVQPVAAVVINPDEAQDKIARLQEIGCDILPDFDSLIAKYSGKLDICCIPTGIAMHKSMSVAAVEAGFNVYVEKPVSATVDEARAMTAAAARCGKFIAVGYQNMYQPETRRVKEILTSGIIGKAVKFKCYGMWPRSFAYYGRNKWAGALVGADGAPVLDSPFTNALAHDLQLQLFFAGCSFNEMVRPARVQAAMMRANNIQSCDTASIRIESECGKELIFTVTHASNFSSHPAHIIKCEKGEIHFARCTPASCKVYNAAGEEIEDVPFSPAVRQNIWDALIDRINGKDAFICTPEMAAVHTLVSNAVFDSAPIVDVPSELVSTVTFDETGVERNVVSGIEKIIRRTYDEERILDSCDYPFIQRGEVVEIDGYSSFENRFGYGK